MTAPRVRRRVAVLSWSNARFDSRTERLARSLVGEGFDVVVYARWEIGTAEIEVRAGYRVVRVPVDWRLAFWPTRSWGRRRLPRLHARLAAVGGPRGARTTPTRIVPPPTRLRRFLRLLARRPVFGTVLAVWRQLMIFPIRPMAWAVAVEEMAEPADLWHAMWAGSLPALDRLRRRYGGAGIYDSRDVLLHSRGFGRLPRWMVAPLVRLERRWAARADAVITVNTSYARILEQTLRVRIDAVVRNCPERRPPPNPRPDLIRQRLGLAPSVRVVLYQGQITTERGIEEGMAAILDVPNAVLVLLGFGRERDDYERRSRDAPYRGRVHVLEAVPPSELLDWTASADVALMAIQPTTLNHRYTTPNKLWEALAAGTPIVASDLPGMAEVVAETGAGVLCDPTSAASIATALRTVVDLPEDDREALRARAVDAAHDRYNWETQAEAALAIYRRLLGPSDGRSPDLRASP